MLPAIRLRLLESARRGGLPLLGVAALGVGLLGAVGDDPPGARYALATDLAAALAYLAALFFGALPLAADRERRRALLPAATPVPPWAWAAGNALGAALLVGSGSLLLFLAAAVGPALEGGLEARVAGRLDAARTVWLHRGRPVSIALQPGAEKLRFRFRVAHPGDVRGTADVFTIAADGVPYTTIVGRHTEVPARGDVLVVENVDEAALVGIDPEGTRWLGANRPFLLNALAAGAGPALGAAALASFAVACSAMLAGPVAALLAACVLLLGAMRGFLLEAAAEGPPPTAHAVAHSHGAVAEPPGFARAALRSLLAAVPDLHALDASARAARGEWVGWGGARGAAPLLLGALAVACALGGAGVRLRRLG
jgi:hypothetical protein